MRLSALNRLRLAFLGIGALLLLPLGLLAHSVTARLEAQRRLRHEVVAERIFDELERELTLVLSQELARPSAAYDAPSTDAVPSYVLGYFTSTGGHPRVVPAESSASSNEEKAQRVEWAVGEWVSRRPVDAEPAPGEKAPAPVATTGRAMPVPPGSAPRQQVKPAPQSSPEILKRLNRGELERQESGY
jgi:hypothetical protein